MDESYFEVAPQNMGRGLKVLVLLLALRIQNPASWTAFLSLNPSIRKWLLNMKLAGKKDPATVKRRICKLANLVSVVFLYTASSNNRKIPKDYISLFLMETYYGKLVPPKSPITVSPTTAPYFRLSSYKEGGVVKTIYKKKHYVIFPIICGQILSNYLTPTQYKLNQRYFSTLIKARLLDPIWTNFRLGVRSHTIDWMGMSASYAKHNIILILYMMAQNFKSGFWKTYCELGIDGGDHLFNIISRFISECGFKANVVANFIYTTNLLSMFLLSFTAPMLTRVPQLKQWYKANAKQTIKVYMRAVGFTAGLLTLMLQKLRLQPTKKEASEKTEDQFLGPDFYNAVSLYFSQLIILSKWRILKENHPWFRFLKVGTWQRMETGVMCFFVWKLMNLNDYISRNTHITGNKELDALKSSPWIKAIDRIMN